MWQVYQSLVVDILAGKPLLKLVGPEGSGKSQILTVLAQRLPGSQQVVLLDPPPASLAELLQAVASALGLALECGQDLEGAVIALRDCLAQLRGQDKQVVLLMDAAEQLVPETLAGLLALAGDGGGVAGLSLLLSGREGLENLLQQLAAAGEEAVFMETYTLEPLTESETRQYLRYCAAEAGMSREDYAQVFSETVVANIFKMSQGNMRLINILAEEALENSCEEKSFMVLLDQVEPEATEELIQPRLNTFFAFFRRNPFLGGGIGLCVVGLVLASFFLRSGERPGKPAETSIVSSRDSAAKEPAAVPATSSFAANLEKGQNRLEERLAAGAQWLAGGSAEKYTIQLMVLSSSSAEYSLTRTLVTAEYAPVIDQLYILHNQQVPPTLYVFYGVYDTLDAAREARNTMPLFLQEQGPYPLAIGDAVEKIKSE